MFENIKSSREKLKRRWKEELWHPMAIFYNNIKSFIHACTNIVDKIIYKSIWLVDQAHSDTHVYHQHAFCFLNILFDETIFSTINVMEYDTCHVHE